MEKEDARYPDDDGDREEREDVFSEKEHDDIEYAREANDRYFGNEAA